MATQRELLNAGLTRTQVAQLLEISDREVAKLDGRQLHPSRAPNRAWLYDPAEVRSVLMNAAAIQTTELDGDVTAAAFAMFEARKSLPKVVVALKAPAHVVMRLREQYDRMRGSLTLAGTALSALKRLLGESALRDGNDVISATQRALEAKLEEGRLDATEFGVVLDETTGKMRPVVPLARSAAAPVASNSLAQAQPSAGAANAGTLPVLATAEPARAESTGAQATLGSGDDTRN